MVLRSLISRKLSTEMHTHTALSNPQQTQMGKRGGLAAATWLLQLKSWVKQQDNGTRRSRTWRFSPSLEAAHSRQAPQHAETQQVQNSSATSPLHKATETITVLTKGTAMRPEPLAAHLARLGRAGRAAGREQGSSTVLSYPGQARGTPQPLTSGGFRGPSKACRGDTAQGCTAVGHL